jgi:hypothetical protein
MKTSQRLAIATVACGLFAAAAHGQSNKKSSITPPVINHSVICENAFEWTLRLSIWDDVEVASYLIQLQDAVGVNIFVAVEPGLQLVERDLTGNSVGRTLLVLASDMEGNFAKQLVAVPPDYCGCVNCE